MSPPRPPANAFRYEDELCTLPEGVTLRDWRKSAVEAPVVPSWRRRLRARLRPARLRGEG